MFYKHSKDGYKRALPGIQLKSLAYGDKTHVTEFLLEGGYELPRHKHPHEQSGYLVSGRMRLFVGDETFEVEPGDSWSILGNVEHWAQIIEDSVAVEVFSPLREDYLPSQ